MLDILLWLAIGAFVGWNFPQPEFAKTMQEKKVINRALKITKSIILSLKK